MNCFLLAPAEEKKEEKKEEPEEESDDDMGFSKYLIIFYFRIFVLYSN